jgi:hypothetical protein
MVELKSSIPIGAITEISAKCFTIAVKVEKTIINFMVLTWPQGTKKIPINLGGQIASLGANVVAIKYCCFNEIYFEDLNKP